ncbi:MAG TPA: YihY/virulence factor BrkB family protein, partial [Lacipirellula sp.]
MKLGPKNLWRILKQTFSDWSEDKAPELGAALAFYTALSIAPLLVIVLGIAAFFLGEGAARGHVMSEMQSMVGQEGASAIGDMIQNADKPTEGTIATVLSVITLLFGASGVFGQLQSSMNTIWEVEPKPGRGIWGMIRDRFLSFTMVLGLAFLLLVSMILSAVIAAAGNFLSGMIGDAAWIGHVVHIATSMIVLTLLFAAMFKYLPDAKIGWRDVMLGAVVTAVLFTVGKFAIGLYLGHSSMASSYGVAGSFVVLLVWVYYSAQILFFGAELTQVYANNFGSRIVPSENARRVTDEA